MSNVSAWFRPPIALRSVFAEIIVLKSHSQDESLWTLNQPPVGVAKYNDVEVKRLFQLLRADVAHKAIQTVVEREARRGEERRGGERERERHKATHTVVATLELRSEQEECVNLFIRGKDIVSLLPWGLVIWLVYRYMYTYIAYRCITGCTVWCDIVLYMYSV